MKLSKPIALFAVCLALAACSKDEEKAAESTTAAATTTTAATAALPTAADLNTVLMTATDPAVPVDAKVRTVQNGETAPALFETMTRAKEESNAQFQVVDPVLPGYTPNSVLTTVDLTLPDRENQRADNVEFIYEDGVWKLSQTWACTLITNTVTPEQVPPMCATDAAPQPGVEAPVAPDAPVATEEAPPAP